MLGSLRTSLRRSDPGFDTRLTNPLADRGFKHATQDTAFTVHRPWQTHRGGRSEQRSSWHSLEQRSSWPKLPPPAFKHAALETCHAVVKTCHTGSPTLLLETCPSKQAGLTVGLLWSIWATLWLSLEQRSSWPRLQTSYSGPFFPPGRFHSGCVHCTRAFSLAGKAIATESLEQTNPPTDGTPRPDRPSIFVGCRVWIKHTAGKERLSFGKCLGSALGAAGSVQWTAGLVCTSDTACLRLRSEQLSGGVFAG